MTSSTLRRHFSAASLLHILAAFLLVLTPSTPRAQEPGISDTQAIEDCLEMGTRREGGRGSEPVSDVEIATFSFRTEVVHDAAAMCNRARKLRPDDAKVVAAQELCMQMVRMLVFGLNGPKDDERRFSQAFVIASTERKIPGAWAKFYLGMAFEYGLGAKADRLAAIHWYGAAERDGDMIAARERARLESIK